MKNFNWLFLFVFSFLPFLAFGNIGITISSNSAGGNPAPPPPVSVGVNSIDFNIYVNPEPFGENWSYPATITLINAEEPLFVVIESFGQILNYAPLNDVEFDLEPYEIPNPVQGGDEICTAYRTSMSLSYTNYIICQNGDRLTYGDEALIMSGKMTLRILAGNSLLNPTIFSIPQNELNVALLGIGTENEDKCITYYEGGTSRTEEVIGCELKPPHFPGGGGKLPNIRPLHYFSTEGHSLEKINLEDVNTSSENSVTIYPNPFKEILNIRFQDLSDINTITVLSVEGKIIEKINASNQKFNSLNTQNWLPGLYFIKIQGNNLLHSYKIMKN